MEQNTHQNSLGHASAALTIFIWGTTFISTKILLEDFTPVEILFFRFCLGFFALLALNPRRMAVKEKTHHLYFAAAGLCGVTLYFLLENIALTYTLASNVGIMVSVSPFFTAILTWLFCRGARPGARFLIGFSCAMAGIFLITWSGSSALELNPKGDLLALLAAVMWAFYSVLSRRIGEFQYNNIQVTRRIFSYGIVFMIPALFLMEMRMDFSRFLVPAHLGHLMFLGFGASALCFGTWNFAVRVLGAVKTSVYIYLVPAVTVTTSVIVLHERITGLTAGGIVLTLVGLFLSESRKKQREEAVSVSEVRSENAG